MLGTRLIRATIGRSIPPSAVRGAIIQRGARSLSTATTGETYDAVIIGAGVIGSSIALEMARAGKRTLNVDRAAGAGQGSTSYSSGICRMFYSVLDSVKFSWEGYDYWKRWPEHIGADGLAEPPGGHARLRECGAVLLRCGASAGFVDTVVPLMEQVGIPTEELDRAELERRFGEDSPFGWDLRAFGPPRTIDDDAFGTPSSDDAITGACFLPVTGYVSDPQLATRNLADAASHTGKASFKYNAEVVSIDRDDAGARVAGITLADGTKVSAPVVVNAAGPWSSHLTALAFPDPAENDARVSTRALRQEVAYVPEPPGSNYGDEGPIFTDFCTGVYMRPEVGKKILVGGIEPECDVLEWEDSPDDASPSLSDHAHTTYMWRAAMRMPSLQLPGASDTQGIVACYDATEDWTPIYDKSALPGYYQAIGTSGNQFKNAGVAGALMHALVERCESGVDHDSDPLQFELARTGCGAIDTRSFSRLRSLLETSGSVLG